jgi:hypothetical protein
MNNEEIKENIERLAEIMDAASMVRIGQELKDELETIMNYLKVMKVVEIVTADGKGFSFTDEAYKDLFINARDNF